MFKLQTTIFISTVTDPVNWTEQMGYNYDFSFYHYLFNVVFHIISFPRSYVLFNRSVYVYKRLVMTMFFFPSSLQHVVKHKPECVVPGSDKDDDNEIGEPDAE